MTLYLVAFMEVLIYTALFILIYQILKKKVTCNLERVNDGLKAIAAGDLDTVINVRAYKEFAELSDDVNATVSSLKHYIHAAEERINQELEVARQIQNAALPRVFPARPDFDLFASMHAAKEVGGDFYDFYLLDRYTLVFLIADVSGKGIPAAMFMMRAKTLLKDLAESGRNVDEVFTRANAKPYDPTAAAAPDITLPAEERPIGGLGLHMVRKMSTSMQYRYSEGENRLSVGFELEKQP